MAIDLTGIRNFARETLKGDTSGHDFLHAKQVARLAVSLYEEDHGQISKQDQVILEAAALLHDTIDDKVVADVAAQQILVDDLLRQSGIAPIGQALVAETITHLSYSANLKKHYDLPLLGQYVQDADRLEALGAIGIARTFAYGGQKGHPLYDPAIKPVQLQTKDQYRHHQTTSVNHFYEKLLKLADQLNTPAGQEEGQRRSAFQRLGLGRQLLNQAFDQANVLGKSRVWLGVWEHNQNALAFYQKIGFTPFSDHVFQLGTDAQRDILMEKVLS
ncbi:GNAT family N-acetyltransferase [uncultured Fructobacillus sp.]|uniref:GNAT family N-acetyltransferase n=1 Tax=uncultured Fructobacillus sp. TaxID=591942 RepID=UPI002596EC0F|nr:GNAT family N-acetyltransferase [uncultured Fructobacillus sp.]